MKLKLIKLTAMLGLVAAGTAVMRGLPGTLMVSMAASSTVASRFVIKTLVQGSGKAIYPELLLT